MTESTDSTGMTQRLPRIFPQRLSDNYKKVHALLKGVRTTSVDLESDEMRNVVEEFETLLNDSLPQNEAETLQRVQEYLHYHRDPVGYYQHLNDSKLRFLVLWTDYKAISNHFRVRNLIHVRWNGEHYECQVYDKTKRVRRQRQQEEVNTATNEA
jgi:hypothetical protein